MIDSAIRRRRWLGLRRGGGGSALWAPTRISGLVLWLRSDAGIALNGSTVSGWSDQSGQGNHVTQASAPLQPTFTTANASFGGKPTVDFSRAAATVLVATTPLVAGNAARTVFIANRRTLISAGEHGGLILSTSGSGGNSYLLYNWTTAGPFSDGAHAQNFSSPPAVNLVTVIETFTMPTNPAGTGLTLSRVNGAAAALGSGAAIVAEVTSSVKFSVGGGDVVPSQAFQGSVSEVVVYNRVLSAGEITEVEKYMGARNGVPI